VHWIIFVKLKQYVETRLGSDTWNSLLEESGIGPKVYLTGGKYPDQEAVALVTTASKMTGIETSAILEDFGEFITPDLVQLYRHMIKPEWKTLDLIEHAEETIHKLIRVKDPDANPPRLECSRLSEGKLVLTYSSSRQMCGVAKGIARGLARHYGEQIQVSESGCMLEGNPSCQIQIELVT